MVAKKIKVKVGEHQLSPNGPFIFNTRVLDGVRGPWDVYKSSIVLTPLTVPIVEGPYFNKSVWQRLKEFIK